MILRLLTAIMSDAMKREWKVAYASMPAKAQARVLAMLAHELSFWNRYQYEAVTKDVQRSARALTAANELQHRITEQLYHLLANHEKVYSDEDFMDLCWSAARQADCEDRLNLFFQEIYDAHGRFKESLPEAAHST